MADITVTAASVLNPSGGGITNGKAGVAITAGQSVYYDSSTSTYKLAQATSSTASNVAGVALNGAASGQPVQVMTSGALTAGATLTKGLAYYVSAATAGGICPYADLSSGNYVSLLGIATSSSILALTIIISGVTE